MKKIISAFAVLALAIVIPCVASSRSSFAATFEGFDSRNPNPNSCKIAYDQMSGATLDGAEGAKLIAATAQSASPRCDELVVAGTISQAREMLIAADNYIKDATKDQDERDAFKQALKQAVDKGFVLQVSSDDDNLLLTQDDANFLTTLKTTLGIGDEQKIIINTVGISDITKLRVSNITSVSKGIYVINISTSIECEQIDSDLKKITGGAVYIGNNADYNDLSKFCNANGRYSDGSLIKNDDNTQPPPAPARQGGEQAVASTATDSVVLGFGVFALIALAGSVLVTRKLVRK